MISRALSRTTWIIIGFLTVNLIVRALMLGCQGDEGVYLTQSMLVARGQTPILDFFVFNNQVNFYYFYGTFIRLLGHHFWVLRLVSAGTSILTILLIAAMIEHLLPPTPERPLWAAISLVGLYTSTTFFPYTVMVIHVVPTVLALASLAACWILLERAVQAKENRRILPLAFAVGFLFSAAVFFRSLILIAAPALLLFGVGLLARIPGWRMRAGAMAAAAVGLLLPALPSLYIFWKAPSDFLFNLFQIRVLFQQSAYAGSWINNLRGSLMEFLLGWPWVEIFHRLPHPLQIVVKLKSLPEIFLLGGLAAILFSKRESPRNALAIGLAGLSIGLFVFVQRFQSLGYYAPALVLFYCSVPFLAGGRELLWRYRRFFVPVLALLAIRMTADNVGSILVSRSAHSTRSWKTYDRIIETVRPHVSSRDPVFEYEGLATFLLDLTPPPGFAQMIGTRTAWQILSEEQMRRHRIFSPAQAEQQIRRHFFSAAIVPDRIDPRIFEALRQEYELKLSVNGICVFIRPQNNRGGL